MMKFDVLYPESGYEIETKNQHTIDKMGARIILDFLMDIFLFYNGMNTIQNR